MGIFKILAGLLLLSPVWAKELEWKEKSVELKVPQKSVVGIEFSCRVRSVFTNDLVQADYNQNTVFVSVGTVPTSVGVSCEKDGIFRGYTFYLFPSGGGDVFFKVKDDQMEKLVVSKKQEIDTSKEELLTLSRYVLKSVLKGELPQGFYVSDFQEEFRKGEFRVKVEKAYVGSSLVAYVVRVRPDGFMQKKLTEDLLFDKGTTLVWLEKTGYVKHDEEIKGVIIKLRGEDKEREDNLKTVIPFK
ncbi:MAG: hypothetical protein QW212_00055 [Nitrososphaerales archaeon]